MHPQGGTLAIVDVGTIVLVVLLGLVLTGLPLLFAAGREGRLRRGEGWYLDVTDQRLDPRTRQAERLQSMRGAVRSEGTSRRKILIWTIGGAGDLALAVVVGTALNAPVAAVVIALVGLALLGMAAEAWRVNRYLAGDATIRADELLAGAERAETQARRLLAGAERVKARELLLRAADDLRTYAPGSGRPDEVLARSRALRESAERL